MGRRKIGELKELEKELSKRTGLSQAEVRFILDHFFDILLDFLIQYKTVNLTGFGKFRLKLFRTRHCKGKRNILSKKPVAVPAHYRVIFYHGSHLKLILKKLALDFKDFIPA
jgi:DNA-binding protein HU-beta/integration host factor subunit beta